MNNGAIKKIRLEIPFKSKYIHYEYQPIFECKK